MGWILGLGNGVVFRTGSSTAWSSYWTTRIPTYLNSKIISDTQIDLFWTGGGDKYRIYISTDGVSYSEKGTSVTNSYSATGLSANTIYYFYVVAYSGSQESTKSNHIYTVTPPTAMYDGETTAWYDFNEETNMTIINNLVSQVDSKIGTGNNLEQATEGSRPALYNEGLSLIGKILQKTFTYRQPMYVYAIVTQTINNNQHHIIKGNGTRASIRGNNPAGRLVLYSPNVGDYASSQNADLVFGKVGIIRAFYNGANSFLQIDDGTAATCSFDTTYYDGAYISNIIIKELIFRKTIVSDIYDYLVKKKISVNNKYTFKKGKLIITFDNIDWSPNPTVDRGTYTNGFRILKEKGVKGTFYIVSDWIGTGTFGTWAKALEMYNDGMDMQCHSKTHAHLTTLSEAQIDAEMLAQNNAFVANGLPIPKHHCYPFGEYNANVITYISDWRDSCRTIEADLYYQREAISFINTNKYIIRAINVDSVAYPARMVSALAALDQASKVGGALFVYAHGCSAITGILPADLENLIDTALGLGMDIITHSQFYDLLD